MSNTLPATELSLNIRRTFDAPRDRVFAAWTTPEMLKRWFNLESSTCVEAASDAKVGGKYRIAMRADDGEMNVLCGTYTELRAPERLAFTWQWEEDDATLGHESFVSIDFSARGNQTEMSFTHVGFLNEESRMRHEGGWTSAIDKIPNAL